MENKIAIHCPTEELMFKVIDTGRAIGEINRDAAIVADWNRHKEYTAIILGKTSVIYGSRRTFVNLGYSILLAEEFLKTPDLSKCVVGKNIQIKAPRNCFVDAKIFCPTEKKQVHRTFQGIFHEWGNVEKKCPKNGKFPVKTAIVECPSGNIYAVKPWEITFDK